jgi:hypothetical protein
MTWSTVLGPSSAQAGADNPTTAAMADAPITQFATRFTGEPPKRHNGDVTNANENKSQ